MSLVHATHVAMVALLSRWTSAAMDHWTHTTKKEEAEKAIAAAAAQMSDCITGMRAMGFDMAAEGTWDRVWKEFGEEVRQQLNLPPQRSPDSPASDTPASETPKVASVASPVRPALPVFQMVLNRLEELGEAGSKAAPIRDYIQQTYGIEIHPKTVGMSLYRLLQKGRVRRRGHMWFFVPQSAETKNPGVGAPGSVEDLLG